MQPQANSSADGAALRAQLAAVLEKNGSLSEENRQLRQETEDQKERLQRLAEQLAALQRLLFGSKSERVVFAPDPQQGALFEEAAPPPPEPEPTGQEGTRRKPRRRTPWTSCRRTCPARRS